MAMAKQWNPMADAYKNNKFNTYEQGPGANLDANQQPAALANNSGNVKYAYRLCLKNVPKEMTATAVRNLCSSYGKVIDVRTSPKTPYVFVSLATMNDMERVMTGLKNNPHGISADIAKESKKPVQQAKSEVGANENQKSAANENQKSGANTLEKSGEIDMSKRVIKGPFTNPPRPHPVKRNQMHDVHDSDRNKPRSDSGTGGKQMYTGRPYYKEPKEITEQIKRFSESSKGSYDPQKNEYTNKPNASGNEDILGACVRCKRPSNSVCERCEDFYCSIECQTIDWPRHRYICFQMPLLVPQNSNIKGTPLPQDITNLTSATKKQNYHPLPQQKSNSKEQTSNNKENLRQNGPQSNPKQNNPIKNNEKKSDKKEETNNKSKEEPKVPTAPKSIVNAETPASGSTVAITSVSKTNLVYIRSLAPEDNLEYIKTLNEVNSESKKSEVIDKPPKRGDILLTDFEGSGFYRVCVLDPNAEKGIAVVYIDFGNMDYKKVSELKCASPKVYEFKRHAMPLKLKNVGDFHAHEKILEYLYTYAETAGRELKLIYDDFSKGCELIDLATNENINNKIVEMMKVSIPKDSDPPIMCSDIEMRLLQDGEKVPVYVLDNSFLLAGSIACIHESDLLKIEIFNKQLQEYAETTKEIYTPREQELCLVKYEEDGVWYRAQCLEIVGDGNPSVLFIDYGNMSTAKIENIRKYPKELIFPCLTSACIIQGLPRDQDLDDKVVKRLTELIPINEKIILDKVVSVPEQELNEVYIDKIINTLKEEKLI